VSRQPIPHDRRPSGALHVGNAEDDGVDYRGWFVGSFLNAEDARSTEDVEVKWGLHPAGETRASWNQNETATTLCLLVSGRFNLDFDADLVTLARPGDHAVWGPGIKHRWHAVDDSVVLTVRCPSLSS
jgi:uncharacterized cupin superfamily protein